MLQIPDHPYRILIISSSGSGKPNALLNFMSHEPYIDKMNLYAKNTNKAKYQWLTKKCKCVGSNYCVVPRPFIEYWNDMDNIYKNID